MKSRKAAKQTTYRQKLLYVAVAACFSAQPVYANPVGGQVVRGTVGFSQQGSTLTVTNTPGAIVNWQQFNIGAGETTRFVSKLPIALSSTVLSALTPAASSVT